MSSGNTNVNERKQFAFDLNVEPLDDDNSDFSENADLCTICLEPLAKTTNDPRTLVVLNCNHKFHLDCIGSAFNARGMMQCPNCKQIEAGQWRYANNRPIADLADDDSIVEDEEGAYTEMAIGVEWCPYGFGHQFHLGTPRCPFIEYSFTFPESSAAAAAGVDPRITEWIATSRGVRNFVPVNRRIFWSLSSPGVMTGRHYVAHPSYDHTPVPSINPCCVSVARYAPVPPPNFPNMGRVQLDLFPSLLGDSSASVSAGSMFSSDQEEVARRVSGYRPNGPTLSASNQVDDNAFNQYNVLEEAFTDLAQQFEIERQSYFTMYNGRGGENGGSDSDSGSDSDAESGGGGNGAGN